jgi:hypothetical protein
MKCRNAKSLIFEFVDGLDDDTKRLELEQHLAGCGACDKFATQLTRSLDLLHRAPREETSDNFAWKIRLKLNQERNAVQERHASYGVIVRSWNLRYATAAVAAAAVVLVGGLAVFQSGLAPSSPVAGSPPSVAVEKPAGMDESQGSAEVAQGSERPSTLANPVDQTGGRSTQTKPTFSDGARPRLVSDLGAPRQSRGRIIGVDLIDRSAPLSVAQMDSLVHTQLDMLTAEEQVQYLSQYIILLQRHLFRAHVERLPQR